MLNGTPSPVVCTANAGNCQHIFVNLNELFTHPLLNDDEKLFWLWLANHRANDRLLSVSLTYEQISIALNKPVRFVHRTAFRLKLMGFLSADIPIWYGEPTKEMRTKMFTYQLLFPAKSMFKKEEHIWMHPRFRKIS